MALPPVTAPLPQQVAALREGAGLRALDDLAAVSVRGRDRLTWLNGMVTNDTRSLAPGRGVYAAVVGLKGKVLTDLFAGGREDEVILVMPAARVDEVLAHFDHYIVMEDVFVARRDGAVVTLQGPKAASLAASLAPAATADRLGRGGLDLLLDDNDARYELLASLASEGRVTPVSDEAWEVARLEAGVAAFGRDFDTSNFVQEAGVTRRAVSFQKGCYLGQEVVCRLEMRGHVQKSLIGLVVEGDAPPAGEPVMTDGKDVGRVTSAATSVTLPGRAVALAMLRQATVEANAPVEVRGARATLTLRPVP
ncbi:MAG: glycine cleavage T C-terminal barrel domain-containing protein [Polyangiales bacterium]